MWFILSCKRKCLFYSCFFVGKNSQIIYIDWTKYPPRINRSTIFTAWEFWIEIFCSICLKLSYQARTFLFKTKKFLKTIWWMKITRATGFMLTSPSGPEWKYFFFFIALCFEFIKRWVCAPQAALSVSRMVIEKCNFW